MHQKKEGLEYVLKEITDDFFIRGKQLSQGDWERYYFAKSRLNQIRLNEQNGSRFVERILLYLLEKFDNFKSRKRLRKAYKNSANIYESFFKTYSKIPDYDP